MAKYRTNFELGLDDVDMIEESLSRRASELSRALRESGGANDTIKALKDQLTSVRKLLGDLHNQKIWYQPKTFVPQG